MKRPTRKDTEVRKRRVSLEGAIKLITRDGDSSTIHKHIDISIGGVFVESAEPLPVGTEVDLELRLMRLPFKASATVAWVRTYSFEPDKPAGMGLEFLELSSPQKRGLYLQISEALAQGEKAKLGTPPTPAELEDRREREKKLRESQKVPFWKRLRRPRN